MASAMAKCSRCGLEGHSAGQCPNKPFYAVQCSECKKNGHRAEECRQKWRKEQDAAKELRKEEAEERRAERAERQAPICFHCGERGHVKLDCAKWKVWREEAEKDRQRRQEEAEERRAERLAHKRAAEERKAQWLAAHSCFQCGKPGHMKADCPMNLDKQVKDCDALSETSLASTLAPLSQDELRRGTALGYRLALGQALGPTQRELVERCQQVAGGGKK